MADAYIIQAQTLKELADEVRRLAETEQELYPADMIDLLGGLDLSLWAYLDKSTLYLFRADEFIQNGNTVEVRYG